MGYITEEGKQDLYTGAKRLRYEDEKAVLSNVFEILEIPKRGLTQEKFLDKWNRSEWTIGKINPNQNVLVICPEEYMGDFFAARMASMLKVHNKVVVRSMTEIINVFWGVTSSKQITMLPEGLDSPHLDTIPDDIMAIMFSEETFTSYKKSETAMGELIVSLCMNRYNKLTRNGQRKLSWLFYTGTQEGMKQRGDFLKIYNFFNSNKSGFTVIDLSRKYHGSNNSEKISTTSITVPTDSSVNAQNLSDLY